MRKIIILLGVLLGVNVLFSQQEKVIQEVIINGVKKRIFYEGNKMVLDIDKNPIYENTTVIEVLGYIPKINTGDGKVKVDGKSNVLVLVDGRESTMSIESIPTSIVKKIEVISNASSKYGAQYDSVINIILDRWKNQGIRGNIFYNTTISNKKISNFGSNNIVYNSGKFSTNFNYSFNAENNNFFDNSYQEMKSYNYHLNNETDASRRVNYFGVSSNYNINETKSIGFEIGYTDVNINTPSIGRHIFYNKLNSIDSVSNRYKERLENNEDIIGSIYYSSKGKKIDWDTYIYHYYSVINSDNNTYYSNDLNRKYNQIINNNYNVSKSTIANIFGHYKIDENSSIDFGFRMANISGENKQEINTDILFFDFRESIYSQFLEWNKKWDKLNIKIGNRVEYFDRKIIYNNLDRIKQSQLDFFPSLYLGYEIDKKNTVSFSASRKIDRAIFKNILPYSYHISFNEKYLGNPNLKNQVRYNVELDYSYNKNLFISTFYSYLENSINNVMYIDGQEITHIPQNYNSYNLGMSIVYTKWLKKWWYINARLSLYNKKNKGFIQDEVFDNNNLSIKYTFSNMFKLRKWGALVLQNTYSSPSYDDLYKTKIGVKLDIKYTNKLIDDRLIFSITIRDILRTYYNRTEAINQRYYSISDRNHGWHQYVLGITYNFDKGKKTNKNRENMDYSETQRTNYE